jgi:NAD(P)-dependent dehydrogenase (short-subunit alcohol dehydrogenase family)
MEENHRGVSMRNRALITGASRGLGLALARALATDGWELIIDARGDRDLRVVVDGLAALAPVHAVPGDIADERHRRALLDTVDALGGGLDLLVHNASLLGPSPQPALAAYPLDELERVYAANVFAPLRLTQLLLPRMAPDARVISITSDAAVEPYEGWGGYGSSKAALEQWTRVLAVERPELRVYVVDPGDMRTQMHQDAFPGDDISDRPPPEASVPGLLAVIEGDLPSGRYDARALGPQACRHRWRHERRGGTRRLRAARRPGGRLAGRGARVGTRRSEVAGRFEVERKTRGHDLPASSRLRRPR